MGMDCRELFEQVRREWPTVALDRDAWCLHLEALGWGDDAPPFPGHLYLALACARGVPEALRIVESRFFGALGEAARRKLRDRDAAADAVQLTRERLFAGPEPRILSYRGSGHLRAWLMMVMNRVIATSKRAEAAQLHHEHEMIELWRDIADGLGQRPALDPELVQRVERCLRHVVAELPARDRAVLKLYYLEGLSIDAIGVIYHRHRSQVARWLAGYREAVRDELRRQVQAEVGALHESELGSLLRLVHDELDVTISTLLASSHGPARAETTDSELSR